MQIRGSSDGMGGQATDLEDTADAIKSEVPDIIVYRRRWLVLFIFCACNLCNAMHWMQYGIIANIMSHYYSASIWAVDGLTVLTVIAYVVFILPVTYFMDKKGLKWTVLIGTILTTAGSWIKVVSVGPDLLYVAFIAQSSIALACVFLFGVPPRLAAVWFGPNQVSTACAIGVVSAQAGIGLGLLVPPYVIHDSDNLESIGNQLQQMFYGGAGISTACLLLVIFLFTSEPPTPPSTSQAAAKAWGVKQNYKSSLRIFLTNKNFAYLLIAHALINSAVNVFGIFINQIFLEKFPGHVEHAGQLGNLNIYVGIAGAFLLGVWLDKTHIYKATGVFIYAGSCIAYFGAMLTLTYQSLPGTYAVFVFIGCFYGAYLALGYEQGVELTYPESEGMMAGLLNMVTSLVTLITAVVGALLLSSFKVIGIISFLCSLLVLGLLLTILIRDDRKRYDAQRCNANDQIPESARMM